MKKKKKEPTSLLVVSGNKSEEQNIARLFEGQGYRLSGYRKGWWATGGDDKKRLKIH